jgi:hypothetical protein
MVLQRRMRRRWVVSYKAYSFEVNSSLSRGSAGSRPCSPSSSIACTDLSFESCFISILFVFVLHFAESRTSMYFFLFCVPIVFCNHRDNNISNYSVFCFQILFLMYHYFAATEIYNAIPVFICAYVWMTRFGNFSYYYIKKDFSLARFVQVSILISGPVCSVHE